jgi:hypothetical protein
MFSCNSRSSLRPNSQAPIDGHKTACRKHFPRVCELRHIALPRMMFLPRLRPVANGGFFFEKYPGFLLQFKPPVVHRRCRVAAAK